jgi:hypothetical protein
MLMKILIAGGLVVVTVAIHAVTYTTLGYGDRQPVDHQLDAEEHRRA